MMAAIFTAAAWIGLPLAILVARGENLERARRRSKARRYR